jgi:RNA polymerase sigma-70 factor, ECF subfamily
VVGRPPDNEAALIARAQAGDSVAYGSLVRAHQDIAFRVACLAGGSAADAEEAAQEGFVKAWRALPRFRTGSPFRPWLLAIVANEARNRRRAAGRRAGLALRAAEQAERSAGSGGAASPETLVLASARRETLLASLAALDERDRSVLTCRYLLELSEEETAAALGCRRGTVKSRTSRALERLRAHEGVEEVGAP